jgi:hypothetical protein
MPAFYTDRCLRRLAGGLQVKSLARVESTMFLREVKMPAQKYCGHRCLADDRRPSPLNQSIRTPSP